MKPAQGYSQGQPPRLAPEGNGAMGEAVEMFILAPQERTAVPLQWSRSAPPSISGLPSTS